MKRTAAAGAALAASLALAPAAQADHDPPRIFDLKVLGPINARDDGLAVLRLAIRCEGNGDIISGDQHLDISLAPLATQQPDLGSGTDQYDIACTGKRQVLKIVLHHYTENPGQYSGPIEAGPPATLSVYTSTGTTFTFRDVRVV